ncbi:hypothetical protein BU14_0624s0005 [Porphyra umbilicalis]|uniref:Uncharacterized protein n=1 Tax=Porphyra umbilicalis TaxID=2786 RepID=A0A1X6NQR8_PORUM|nr:hypothetical protein BU14_0624s0005 [Porphyra umbilicalis]|eukprot:OSX70969.1 hypothetical protein BU14_0624s0005 [Porphyra umbilicalis]
MCLLVPVRVGPPPCRHRRGRHGAHAAAARPPARAARAPAADHPPPRPAVTPTPPPPTRNRTGPRDRRGGPTPINKQGKTSYKKKKNQQGSPRARAARTPPLPPAGRPRRRGDRRAHRRTVPPSGGADRRRGAPPPPRADGVPAAPRRRPTAVAAAPRGGGRRPARRRRAGGHARRRAAPPLTAAASLASAATAAAGAAPRHPPPPPPPSTSCTAAGEWSPRVLPPPPPPTRRPPRGLLGDHVEARRQRAVAAERVDRRRHLHGRKDGDQTHLRVREHRKRNGAAAARRIRAKKAVQVAPHGHGRERREHIGGGGGGGGAPPAIHGAAGERPHRRDAEERPIHARQRRPQGRKRGEHRPLRQRQLPRPTHEREADEPAGALPNKVPHRKRGLLVERRVDPRKPHPRRPRGERKVGVLRHRRGRAEVKRDGRLDGGGGDHKGAVHADPGFPRRVLQAEAPAIVGDAVRVGERRQPVGDPPPRARVHDRALADAPVACRPLDVHAAVLPRGVRGDSHDRGAVDAGFLVEVYEPVGGPRGGGGDGVLEGARFKAHPRGGA